MIAPQHPLLTYTIAHFEDIARKNLFPENNKVPHDIGKCLICHPELLSEEPFAIYLEVVAQSVKVRRPAWDAELVNTINSDRELMGLPPSLSLMKLHARDPEALATLAAWLRDAIDTGLELLAIHSSNSLEFCLEDATTKELQTLVDDKVAEIIACQANQA